MTANPHSTFSILLRSFLLAMVLWVCFANVSMAITDEQFKAKMTRNGTGTDSVVLCPVCPVVHAFMKGGLNLTKVMAEKVSDSLSTLVATMLAIWIAIQAGKLFYPFDPLDRATKILNETFGRVGIGIMVVLFIQNSSLYMNYILYPVIDTSLEVSNTMLTTASKFGSDSGIDTATLDARGCPITTTLTTEERIINSVVSQTRVAQRSIGLGLCSAMLALGFDTCFEGKNPTCGTPPPPPSSPEEQVVKGFFDLLGGLKDAAVAFASKTWSNVVGLKDFASAVQQQGLGSALMDIITRILVAFFIVGIYGYLWLIYPIYMLDFVFKWVVISIFFPIIAVSVIFPGTRGTATAALKGLGHAGMTAVMMATILGIIISMTNEMFLTGDMLAKMGSTDKLFMQQGNYWVVLMGGFLMLHMLKQAPKLAEYFFDSKIDANLANGLITIIRKWVETGVNLVVDVSTAGASAGVRNTVKGVVAAGKMAVPK